MAGDYTVNDKVEVLWDGNWLSATVEEAKGNGLYRVSAAESGQLLFIHARDIKGAGASAPAAGGSPAPHPIKPPPKRGGGLRIQADIPVQADDPAPAETRAQQALSTSPFDDDMELADVPPPPVAPPPRAASQSTAVRQVPAATPNTKNRRSSHPAATPPALAKPPLARKPAASPNASATFESGHFGGLGGRQPSAQGSPGLRSHSTLGHNMSALSFRKNPFSRRINANASAADTSAHGSPALGRMGTPGSFLAAPPTQKEEDAQSQQSLRRRKSVLAGKAKAKSHSRKRHDQVPAPNVKKCLQLQVKRMHVYRGMPIYLLYLIFLTTAAALLYVGSSDETTFRATDAVSQELLAAETFEQINSPDDFYAWLRGVGDSFWVSREEYEKAAVRDGFTTQNNTMFKTHRLGSRVDPTPQGFFAERQNVPLYYLLIRQQRVVPAPCRNEDQVQPMETKLWEKIKISSCHPNLGQGHRQTELFRRNRTMLYPYGSITTDPFEADIRKNNIPPFREVRAVTDEYSGTEDVYTLKLPYDVIYRDDVAMVVDDLDTNGWIDVSTRLIVVETLCYNPTTATYLLVRLTLEVKNNGATTATVQTEPFWFMHINSSNKNRALFAFDIMFTLYLLWALRELFWGVFLNRKLGIDFFGFWECVTVLNLIFILLSLVLKFIVWQRSYAFETELPAHLLYSRLTAYHSTFYSAKDLFIASFWIGWIRLLEYLRYNSRLNAVTETIRLASSDLLSLLIISSFIIVSFGVTANMIYGWTIAEFATIGDSVSWLLRTVFSGDLEPFETMIAKEPTWTPIFLITFLILSWLILLNVVLGILAAGFSAALKNTDDREWSLGSIQKDVTYLLVNIWSSDDDAAELPSKSSLPAYFRKRLVCIGVVDDIVQERMELHEEQQDEILEEFRRDFHPENITITAMLLMNRDGWVMSKTETLDLLRESKNLVAESFASAEAAKQAEKEQLLECINQVGERLHDAIEHTVYTAFVTLDERLTTIEQTMEGEFVATKQDITTTRHNLNDRIDMTEAKHTEETNRVIGAVCGHRRQLDSIAASIFDSESRVRGEIQRRQGGGEGGRSPMSPGKLEQLRQQLELREARLVEREKQLLANLNLAKDMSSPKSGHPPSAKAPVFQPQRADGDNPSTRGRRGSGRMRVVESTSLVTRHRDPVPAERPAAEASDALDAHTQDSDDSAGHALE